MRPHSFLSSVSQWGLQEVEGVFNKYTSELKKICANCEVTDGQLESSLKKKKIVAHEGEKRVKRGCGGRP